MKHVLSLSLISLAVMAGVAGAQPRRAAAPRVERACGVSAVPLSVGNQWTYESIPAPADRQLSEAQQKSTPLPPKKIIIKVTGLETKEGLTTVTLSEDHDGRVHTSTVTCKPGGAEFRFSPNAFWFAGEPGDVYGIELSDVQRKGQSLTLAGGKLATAAVTDWHDDISAKWKHVQVGKAKPALRSGTIEIGRHYVVILPPEDVSSMAGQWKAQKLGVETAVKVTIEPAPANPLKDVPLFVNFLYFADNVGIVQTLNNFGVMYILTQYTVQ